MVTIAKDNDVVTLINVFTVAQEDQQRLVDVLVDATQEVMRKQPGFVSANIHRSLDGTRVTNYAQWRIREAFEAMLQNQEAAEHMGEAALILSIGARSTPQHVDIRPIVAVYVAGGHRVPVLKGRGEAA